MILLSIIIHCFNESKSLPILVKTGTITPDEITEYVDIDINKKKKGKKRKKKRKKGDK